MQLLAKELDSDWGDCAFEIYSDPEDLIIIKFDLASLENPVGLLTYMNMLSSSNREFGVPILAMACRALPCRRPSFVRHPFASTHARYASVCFDSARAAIVSENKLSKVVELWNHRPGDGSLYFCYKPVHVKRAASEVFFTLHPEHRSFQTLRAAQDTEREQRRQLAEQQRADQREALGLDRTYSVAAAGEADGGQQQQQLQQQQQQSLADSAASGPIRQRVGAQDSPGAGAGSGAGSAGAAGSGGTAVIGGSADHESEFERFKRDRAQQSQLRRQQELQQRQQGTGGASAAAAGADDSGADFL
jgi:hypothetical protein